MTSVYVIHAESGPMKIGIATAPNMRLAGMQSGTHLHLTRLQGVH